MINQIEGNQPDSKAIIEKIKGSKHWEGLASWDCQRTSQPAAISFTLPTKGKTEEELGAWFIGEEGLDLKQVGIDVTDFLNPGTDIANAVWYAVHKSSEVEQVICPEIKVEKGRVFLITDVLFLLGDEIEDDDIPCKEDVSFEISIVAYQSKDLRSKTSPVQIIEDPLSKAISLVEELEIPDSKVVDKEVLSPLIKLARRFLDDKKLSDEFEVSPGLRKSAQHAVRLYDSTKKKDVITKERAENLKLGMVTYLRTTLLNREIEQDTQGVWKSLFPQMADFLKSLKSDSRASTFYSRDIEKDLSSVENAQKDIEEGRYITRSHLRFAGTVVYGINEALRSSNVNTTVTSALQELLIESRFEGVVVRSREVADLFLQSN